MCEEYSLRFLVIMMMVMTNYTDIPNCICNSKSLAVCVLISLHFIPFMRVSVNATWAVEISLGHEPASQ